MRKSVDVVIPMQQNFNLSDVQMLFPLKIDWNEFQNYTPDIPFSDDVISFLSALSSSILKDRDCRLYPDVVTFAFFCRKAHLLKLKEQYDSGETLRLGRGIVFHIAPSNVPVNFGYSLVAGLLAGNYNVVRASSKPFPQVDLIVRHIASLGEKYKEVNKRIALVRYGHDSEANDFFTSVCQVRVIWGGDETIARLRHSPLQPRSFDVTFADRYSFAIFNADEMAGEKHINRIAEGFYNDTYLFDQNACSAPHLIVWLGSKENKTKAKTLFWDALYNEVIRKRYHFQDVMAVDKLTTFYQQSVAMPIGNIPTKNNLLVRINLKKLNRDIDQYRGKCGYFTEYDAICLSEIVPVIKYKYQTVAIYGISKETLRSFVLDNKLIGIDRFVKVGDTTAFSLTWDGYNLIDILSRISSIL